MSNLKYAINDRFIYKGPWESACGHECFIERIDSDTNNYPYYIRVPAINDAAWSKLEHAVPIIADATRDLLKDVFTPWGHIPAIDSDPVRRSLRQLSTSITKAFAKKAAKQIIDNMAGGAKIPADAAMNMRDLITEPGIVHHAPRREVQPALITTLIGIGIPYDHIRRLGNPVELKTVAHWFLNHGWKSYAGHEGYNQAVVLAHRVLRQD